MAEGAPGLLDRQIAASLAKLESLRQRAQLAPREDAEVAGDLLAELATTLAELQVTAEELSRRNEELLVAHQHLLEAKTRYEELFEHAAASHLVTTPGLAIEQANRAAVALLRLRPGHTTGRNLILRFHEADRAEVRAKLAQLDAGENEVGWECRLQIADEVQPIAVRVNAVRNGDGRCSSLRWTLRDLTDDHARSEADAQVRSLAAIGQMAASVAHQIRNPIAGLRAMLEVLRARLEPSDTMTTVLTEAFEGIDRVDRTIAALLHFAKPWSSRSTGCDLREVADVVLRRPSRSPRPIEKRLVAGAPVLVAMDSWIAEHLLTELIENAVQAMPEGGAITVELSRREGRVLLVVRDEGIGMTADTMARAFQPFFTTRTRGTGLGLATCRRIVEAHRGTIAASSAPGAGTTVTVDLPVA